MADIARNKRKWDRLWPDDGERWSTAWGTPEAQWSRSIFPRISRFLPVSTILEIAPGHGRWTPFLACYCHSYIGIELSRKCVRVCKRRFRGRPNITFHMNDGLSLGVIPDHSIDFAFSFDSLPHCDAPIIEAYVSELALKLRPPNGVAFIHHSNYGAVYGPHNALWRAQNRPSPNAHWRAEDMSAELFITFCERAGLRCVSQEIVNWGRGVHNDCFSVCTFPGSRWDEPYKMVSNEEFMKEAIV